MAKRTRNKKTSPTAKKQHGPAYNLPEPNDDLAAYGWHMNRLRYPAEGGDEKDIWPGKSIFSEPDAAEFRQEYGIDVNFVCPAYLQFVLDRSPALQNAVYAASKNGYNEKSLEDLQEAVRVSVRKVLIPHMQQRLAAIADYIAGYYAAKMAYVEQYGSPYADADN